LLECSRLEVNIKPTLSWLHQVGLDLPQPLGVAQIRALTQAIDGQLNIDAHLLATLDTLKPLLEQAVTTLDLELTDHLKLCEAIYRIKHAHLLQYLAANGQKKWPSSLMHVYFATSARFANKPWTLPDKEFQRLSLIVDQARIEGNQRLQARLIAFLEATDRPPPSRRNPKRSTPSLTEALHIFGPELLLQFIRSQIGDQEFKRLQKAFKGNQAEFVQMLIESIHLPS
jgi:hypothetical protein